MGRIMSGTKWMIEGREFAHCNCDYGCPCQFNALPTHGNCKTVVGLDYALSACSSVWMSSRSGGTRSSKSYPRSQQLPSAHIRIWLRFTGARLSAYSTPSMTADSG